MRRRVAAFALPLCAAGIAACAPRREIPAAIPPPALPELGSPVPVPAPVAPALPGQSADPLAGRPPGNPITLSARNVDVRVLLLAIAEQAGISLVVDPAISGRTTVSFTAVPALDALRAVLSAAGLGLASGPPVPPVGPTVFFALPVDLELASAELIQQRFGVSAEMARWIVANRPSEAATVP